MKTLSIDIETFSDIDLRKCGVYRYTDSPNFEILLFAYSIDEGTVQIVDLASGEEIPEEIIETILGSNTIKTAFNANFERVALMRHFSRIFGRRVYLDPSSWRCSEVQAAMLGLPLHLEGVGEVLRLDAQKMDEGKSLIRYFCVPCKPTAANGGRTRNLPHHAPDKWEVFKRYNIRDVEVELEIRKKLENYPIPASEQYLYELDQRINDRGIMVDMVLVDQAISCDKQFTVAATERAYELTGLENPNSVSQLKDWLSERGVEVESLSKKNVKELVDGADGEVEEALKLRLLMAKTSVRKYEAIERAVCSDGRVHGLFQFYGANRTGRFAGRLVQFQNLPQNHLIDLKLARDLVKEGRFDDLQMLFGNTPGVLSELIRTAFIPKEGHRFVVADFSAIEARVLSWLAGEKWRLDVFRSHGKIYEASAAQMFHVPIEEITKGSPLRQKGKISELACIAQGEQVLTNEGLIPIEDVTKEHKLWDGNEWVSHDGVIYKGVKKVIEYDGLRATTDHLVWVEGQPRPIQFGEAAASGAHLMQTGDGGKAIIYSDHQSSRRCCCGETKELAVDRGKVRVYDIQNAGRHHRFTVSGKLVHNCGYGGSVGALKAMGALEMGVEEHELQSLIDDWRSANPNIVDFWWAVDQKAIEAVNGRTSTETHGITFTYKSGMLFVTLPSGRNLVYVRPKIQLNQFGREGLSYQGIGNTKKWEKIETYGPKIVENIVQATARDLLAEAMIRLDKAGLSIVAHVHDEVICEVPIGESSVEEVCSIMSQSPKWSEGLPLNADGYECDFYMKD
ncbi:hypothetical protein J0B03_05730 [Alkalibacter rhizosphaerae]|uniref:DNA-directed DNA polymerase n=1 Tax=Alkalibacter rhizosphaerae TaxID=2815577 RepID=A0A974XIX7_9FIRM|nr:DNA polymerase [Alkalibacter rhizosphaerae]QSX09560.1 hypothetical protein J0B03_05730 [Alkalibacter rhizosphaerae]